jgi:hypothetical protein
MNANELADKLSIEWIKHDKNVGILMKTSAEFLYTQVTMIRQQQAEYYSLLVNHDKLYVKVIEQQAEIEALKKEAALQRLSDFTQESEKTLTDEEILKMAANMFHYSEYRLVIDFAKAILKKAQEK